MANFEYRINIERLQLEEMFAKRNGSFVTGLVFLDTAYFARQSK